jgi:hypothetical protein
VRTSTRTPEALEELRASTVTLIDRIRAESVFEPRPGPLCSWCEYAEICPASGRMRMTPPVAPPRVPVQMALF